MNVSKIIRAVEDFPTLPTIYSALLELLSDINSKISDVVDLISKDQATVLKVLKSANAAYFGFQTKVDNITNAVTLLGYYEIKNIVMSLTFIDLLKQTKLGQYVNPVVYWKHSIGVATISRRLGIAYGAQSTENFYLSGLLHDIGKLVAYLNLTTDYGKALQYSTSHRCSLLEAEKNIMGIDHQEIGLLIADKWNLPHDIQNAIKYHHTGIVPNGFEAPTGVVHIANITAKILNMGVSGNAIIEKPNTLVWKELNMPSNTLVQNFSPIINDYKSSLNLLLLS